MSSSEVRHGRHGMDYHLTLAIKAMIYLRTKAVSILESYEAIILQSNFVFPFRHGKRLGHKLELKVILWVSRFQNEQDSI